MALSIHVLAARLTYNDKYYTTGNLVSANFHWKHQDVSEEIFVVFIFVLQWVQMYNWPQLHVLYKGHNIYFAGIKFRKKWNYPLYSSKQKAEGWQNSEIIRFPLSNILGRLLKESS